MQAAVYFRVLPLMPSSYLFRLVVALWFVFMVAAPILTHLLDHALLSFPAKLMAWIGYTWMGVSFIAFCLTLAMYIAQVLFNLTARLFSWNSLRISPLNQAWLIVVLTLVLSIWAVYGHQSLKMQRLNLVSSKLKASNEQLRIVFISDLHLGLMAGKKSAQEVVSKIKSENADIVLCAGDLLDSNLAGLKEIAYTFKSLNPKYGKYAVTGNHETYIGNKKAVTLLSHAGFTVLRNKSIDLNKSINLLGIDYGHNDKCQLEEKLTENLNPNQFNILLKHAPIACKRNSKFIDLQLSGHTHKGQIFPFSLAAKVVYPYLAGLYELENGKNLYVSQGTGSWGPRMRLGTNREITIISLTGKD
jgi:predicted MPP superfamily phosphohydrolase